MKSVSGSRNTNSKDLENAIDLYNEIVSKRAKGEHRADVSSSVTKKGYQSGGGKCGQSGVSSRKASRSDNLTNAQMDSYESSFYLEDERIGKIGEANGGEKWKGTLNEEITREKKKMQITNSFSDFGEYYENEEEKGGKKNSSIYISKEKCQENLEKINEKISDTMKSVFKAYNESNKKQYFSRLFQMRDINCIFSCMFFSLLIIFSIMNEYMGVLMSVLLLVISLQLKFSRSNIALLNSIIGIIFISIATVFSFSNINKEDKIDATLMSNGALNANANRNLLILETIVCLVYASILFIYMISLRAVNKHKEKHLWIYHNIVTLFNFLDICILFSFSVLAFFFIFIFFGATILIISSLILFLSSVFTYSLRKYSNVLMLILQTVIIIANSIIACTSISVSTSGSVEKLVEIPLDESQVLQDNIYLFYMIFLILFLVIHLLYIFYIFFANENMISKNFSQRTVYFSNIFPYISNKSNEKNEEFQFKQDKYVLSLDDDNRILYIQKKNSNDVNVDMHKCVYNEFHLYKHLLLNTVIDLENTPHMDKQKEFVKDVHMRGMNTQLNNSKGDKVNLANRYDDYSHRSRNFPNDFVLNINETSSDGSGNSSSHGENVKKNSKKMRCNKRRANKRNKDTYFLLKRISHIRKEKSENGNKINSLKSHNFYLTNCENANYHNRSLFYSKYTYIIRVLLENYDQLILYLDKKKHMRSLYELVELMEGNNSSKINEQDTCMKQKKMEELAISINSLSYKNKTMPLMSSRTILGKRNNLYVKRKEENISNTLSDIVITSFEGNNSNFLKSKCKSEVNGESSTNDSLDEKDKQNKFTYLRTHKEGKSNNLRESTFMNTFEKSNGCFSLYWLNSNLSKNTNLGAITSTKLGAITSTNLGAITSANLGAIANVNLSTIANINVGRSSFSKCHSLVSNCTNDYINIPVYSTCSKLPMDEENKKRENYFWYYYPGIIGRVYKEWLKCKNLDYKKLNNDFYYLFANSNKLHEFIKSNHSNVEKQEDIKLFDISQVLNSNKNIINKMNNSYSPFKYRTFLTDNLLNSNSLNGIISNFLEDINTNTESLCFLNSITLQSFFEDNNIKQFLSSLYNKNNNELEKDKDCTSSHTVLQNLICEWDHYIEKNNHYYDNQMEGNIKTGSVITSTKDGTGYGSHIGEKSREKEYVLTPSIENISWMINGEKQISGANTNLGDNFMKSEKLRNNEEISIDGEKRYMANVKFMQKSNHFGKGTSENVNLNDLLKYAESLIIKKKGNEVFKENFAESLPSNLPHDSDGESIDINSFDEILSNFIKNFLCKRDNLNCKKGEEAYKDKTNSLQNIEDIYSNIKKSIYEEKQLNDSIHTPDDALSHCHLLLADSTNFVGLHRGEQWLDNHTIDAKKKEKRLKIKKKSKERGYASNNVTEDSKGRRMALTEKRSKSSDGNVIVESVIGRWTAEVEPMDEASILKNKPKESIECLRKKSKRTSNELSYDSFRKYISNDIKVQNKTIDSNLFLSGIRENPSHGIVENGKVNLLITNTRECMEEDIDKKKEEDDMFFYKRRHQVYSINKKSDSCDMERLNSNSLSFLNFSTAEGDNLQQSKDKFLFSEKKPTLCSQRSDGKLRDIKEIVHKIEKDKLVNPFDVNSKKDSTTFGRMKNLKYTNTKENKKYDDKPSGKLFNDNKKGIIPSRMCNLEKLKGKEEDSNQTRELSLDIIDDIARKTVTKDAEKSPTRMKDKQCLDEEQGHMKRKSGPEEATQGKFASEGVSAGVTDGVAELLISEGKQNSLLIGKRTGHSFQESKSNNRKWHHYVMGSNVDSSKRIAQSKLPVEIYCIHSNDTKCDVENQEFKKNNVGSNGTYEYEDDDYENEYGYNSEYIKLIEDKNNCSSKFSYDHLTSSNFNPDTSDLIKNLKKYLSSSSSKVDYDSNKFNDTFLIDFISKYLENNNPCDVNIYNEVVINEKKEEHFPAKQSPCTHKREGSAPGGSGKTSEKVGSHLGGHMKAEFYSASSAKEGNTKYYDISEEGKVLKDHHKREISHLSPNFYDEHMINLLNAHILENNGGFAKNAVLKEKIDSSIKWMNVKRKSNGESEVTPSFMFKEDCHDDYYDTCSYTNCIDGGEAGNGKEKNSTLKGTHLKKKENSSFRRNLSRITTDGQFSNFASVSSNCEDNLHYEKKETSIKDENVNKEEEKTHSGSRIKISKTLNSEKEEMDNSMKGTEIVKCEEGINKEHIEEKSSDDIFHSIYDFECLNKKEEHIKYSHQSKDKEKCKVTDAEEAVIRKADLNLILKNNDSSFESLKQKIDHKVDSNEEKNDTNECDVRNTCSVNSAGRMYPLVREKEKKIYHPNRNIFNGIYGFHNKVYDTSSSTDNELTGMLIGSDIFYESFAYKNVGGADDLMRRVRKMNSRVANKNTNGEASKVVEKEVNAKESRLSSYNIMDNKENSKRNEMNQQVKIYHAKKMHTHSKQLNDVSNDSHYLGSNNVRSKDENCANEMKSKKEEKKMSYSIHNISSNVNSMDNKKNVSSSFERKNMNSSGRISNDYTRKENSKMDEESKCTKNIPTEGTPFGNPARGGKGEKGKEENCAKNNFMSYEICENSKKGEKGEAKGDTVDTSNINGHTGKAANITSMSTSLNVQHEESSKETVGGSQSSASRRISFEEKSGGRNHKKWRQGTDEDSKYDGTKMLTCNDAERSDNRMYDKRNVEKSDSSCNNNGSSLDSERIGDTPLPSSHGRDYLINRNFYSEKSTSKNRSTSSNSFFLENNSFIKKSSDDADIYLSDNPLNGGNVSKLSKNAKTRDHKNDYKNAHNKLHEQYPIKTESKTKSKKAQKGDDCDDHLAKRQRRKKSLNEEFKTELRSQNDDKIKNKFRKGVNISQSVVHPRRVKKREHSECSNLSRDFLKQNRYNYANEKEEEKKIQEKNRYYEKNYNNNNSLYNSEYIQHFNSIINTYSWSPDNVKIEKNEHPLKKSNTYVDTGSTEDSDTSNISNFVKDALEENSSSYLSSNSCGHIETIPHKKWENENSLHEFLKMRKEKHKEKFYQSNDIIKNVKMDTHDSFVELMQGGDIFPTIKVNTSMDYTSNTFNSKRWYAQRESVYRHKHENAGMVNYEDYSNKCERILGSSPESSATERGKVSGTIEEENYRMNNYYNLEEMKNKVDINNIQIFTDDGLNNEYNMQNWHEMNTEINQEIGKHNYKRKYSVKNKKINSRGKYSNSSHHNSSINSIVEKDKLSDYICSSNGTKRKRNRHSPFYKSTEWVLKGSSNGDIDASRNFISNNFRKEKNRLKTSENIHEQKKNEKKNSRINLTTNSKISFDSNYVSKKNLTKGANQSNRSSVISFNEDKFIRNDLTVEDIKSHYEHVHTNSNFSFESKIKEKLMNGNMSDETIHQADNRIRKKITHYTRSNLSRYIPQNYGTGDVTQAVEATKASTVPVGGDTMKMFVQELKKKLLEKNNKDRSSMEMKTDQDAKAKNETGKKKNQIEQKKITIAVKNFKNDKKRNEVNSMQEGKAEKVEIKNVHISEENTPTKFPYSVDTFCNVINSEEDIDENLFMRNNRK
ncbi:conserved Plasmodium membrane protein, unknown function [Plasmodium ovale]|uniref:Uncharacterized protein n=2 Tax=Plasmodium ovale TaxID=36330 RepID=A0A1A8VKX9_PLAOA|nr:conserved Plasmodium protein, unknown function [Plasmodium ovale curtisi]SBS80285.1 conserved Plasmodium protein, unknown function [Plasmodium ovale curtisi]SCD22303.1 conserved Plasmodium membrane protein, unknown function [Plasmodium ovale]